MLKDIDYKVVYSSGEDEPLEFFVDSLIESSTFDLGLGFFSSSGFRALSLGFAHFINNGGIMRILINDILSEKDKEAILRGYSLTPEQIIEEKIITDLTELYETLSKHDKHFFNCLSWLIATKKVEFKAIVPLENNVGIAHQKFGVFQDDVGDKIAFSGSANFSGNALFNNIETLSCYKSWTGEKSETERVLYFRVLFDKLWEGKSEKVRLIPLEGIKTEIRGKFPIESIEEILNDEQDLIQEKEPFKLSQRLRIKLSEIERKLMDVDDKPHFPKGLAPFQYQKEAFENWSKNGMIGFFEMATGTGKTMTSLNCALEIFKVENRIRMLILVPSISLADQWAAEAAEFNFKNIIIANSKNDKWTEDIISQINRSEVINQSFTIVTTYDTFSLPKFQSIVSRLNPDVLFIADEAHNFGTQNLISLHPNKFERRIGLSATPKRHFDINGTDALLSFFNSSDKPTFKLDMAEAIEKKFLCEYFYYPKIVTLTNDELEDYRKISIKLLKFFDPKTKRFSDNPRVNILFQERKRIIHKAENKKNCLRECFKELKTIKEEIKYTLVYVPEGIDHSVDDQDKRIIDSYSQIISEEFNLNQHQFIGDTDNRSEILKRFAEGQLQVLTAMKCLDEGVDVKRTEIAVFCSSTGNPRQFIQRRGRILRMAKGKNHSTIFDMIVIPDISNFKKLDNLQMERAILSGELRRVYEFASLSKNKYQALKTLEDIAKEFNIDIFSTEIS